MEWEKLLEHENRERVVSELKGKANVTKWPVEGSKDSAVLVPLVEVQGEPCVLFTVRSHLLSRHRNQVSFPGGLADAGDSSIAMTALRENEEELGLPPSSVDVWGPLPPSPALSRTPSHIYPIIGCIRHFDSRQLLLNNSEVVSVFTLPLRHVANPTHQAHTVMRPFKFKFPVFLGGPRRIWGLTAFILDMALTYIIPHKFNYVPICSR